MKGSIKVRANLGFALILSLVSFCVLAQTEHSGIKQASSGNEQTPANDANILDNGNSLPYGITETASNHPSGLKVDKKTDGSGVRQYDARSEDAALSIETSEEVLNALYRGNGLFRGFNPEDELVERRSRGSKHFRNPDGTVTALMGAGDLHYLENGKWESILSHIFPNNSPDYTDYKYAALHNAHKIYFSGNPGKPIITKIGNVIYKDWGQPALVWLDADGNILSQVQFNTASAGVPNEESIVYGEIFPTVDAEIKNATTSKKLSYTLKSPSIIATKPVGAVYLAFRETVSPSGSWKLKGMDSDLGLFATQPTGKLLKDILFEDAAGGSMIEIKTPIYFEQLSTVTASCADSSAVDSTANYSGNYLVNQRGSVYDIYTLVPVDWLINPDRDFPLIIDPTTNYYPGGTWPTYTAYRSGNSGSWACATGAYGGRIYPNSDISYGWVDDSWPTSNPYLDGYATFDISALQNNDCVSAVTYFWYHYAERNCGTDISLKFGQVQFNANLSIESSCNVTGTRVRNNNNYYSGTGYNSNGWKSRVGSVADFGLAMPGNQITLGWAYNGGDDCCSSLCTGDDGNYHHVYGYEHSTAKPYASVTYNAASNAPTFATVSVNPTCPGQSTTLAVNGGSLGTSANWEWYSGSCGGTAVGSGASIAVTPASTTTYYVRAEGPCNTTSCVSVTVNVTNTASTAAVSASASISPTCPSQSTTLSITGGALGTGGTWNWYSGSCGGTSVGTGASLAVAPTTTTTYYVRAEGTCNTTACRSVTVTVNTNSAAAASASATVNPTCPSGATTISLTGGTLGTGATWNWYSGSCGGTPVGTGTSAVVSPATTTTYYVRAEGTCNTTTCASITVIVNTNSIAATSASASADPICDGASTTLSITGGALGTGGIWTWYSGSCGGTPEGTGASLAVSPSTSTTYYVRAEGTCNTTTCSSVVVNVDAVPTADAGTASSLCGLVHTLSANPSVGTGTWTQTGVPPSVATFTPNANDPAATATVTVYGTYFFRWTEVNVGCSDFDDIQVDYFEQPTSDAGTGDTACGTLSHTMAAVASVGTGTWTIESGPGTATYAPNANTINAVATVSTIGTYTFEWKEVNGVCSDSSTVVILFPNLPVVSYSGLGATYCISDTNAATLTPTPIGGTFTGNGIAGNDFYPDSAAVGTNVITYTYTDANGCTNSVLDSTVIIGLPVVSFTGLSSPYCEDDVTPVALTGFPVGGVFTGPGISGSNFTAATAGTGLHSITYTYTDGNGCFNAESQATVVSPLPVVAFTGLDTAYCVDAPATTLFGIPSGGTFTGPGISGTSFDPAIAGVGAHTITYTYTDGNGCTNDSIRGVTINGLPTVSFSGLSASYCINAPSVTLTGSPLGGTFTGTGISGNSFIPSVADTGTHNITYSYTDGNGCASSQVQAVTVAPLPSVSFSGLSASYCVDAAPLTLTGSPAGGVFTGPGISGTTFDPSVAGLGAHTIRYLYTSGFGCSDSTSQSVVILALPAVTFSGLNAEYCIDAASTTLIGFPAGGTFSGTGVTGTSFDPAAAGAGSHAIDYTYTDGNGCTKDTTLTTLVNPLPVPVIAPNGPTTFCQGGSVGLAAGSYVSYLWSTTETANTITVTSTGSYSVQVMDANLCSAVSAPISVTVNPNPVLVTTASNANCTGGGDGTVTVIASGATAPYTYIWNDGSGQTDSTAVGLSSGTYTVTVTDNNGCTEIDSATVQEPITPLASSVTTTAVNCNGGLDGMAIGTGSGGTTPYTFQWDDGALQTTSTAQALAAGTYIVVITDVNGCTSTDTGIVSEPLALTSTSTSTDVSCNGDQDGSATISVQGGIAPYNYLWSVGQIGTTVIGLSAGAYDITITDDNGCQLIEAISVNEPAVLMLTVTETDVACAGAANGTATVVAAGGNPTYSYLWGDGQTAPTAVGLSGGLVSVDVLDAKGCSASIGTSISENAAITSTTTAQEATLGNADGIGTVTVVGGVTPYTYEWSDGQTSSTAEELVSGTYFVTVDDNVGCTVIDTVIIDVAMIDAATAFTPNGDGTNDVWTIGDMSLYPDVEVVIFGRWGEVVFTSIGYEDPWDGTLNGQELPMGSYFFIIDLHEGSDQVTGAVTIMK